MDANQGGPPSDRDQVVVIDDENNKNIRDPSKIQENGIRGLPQRVLLNKVTSPSFSYYGYERRLGFEQKCHITYCIFIFVFFKWLS